MKILIANRGEIAVRVIRSCKEMGLSSLAVYSDADRNAYHTRIADEAISIGPTRASESYLNIPNLIKAAQDTGADAVHPGYGFLSENPAFCRAVESAGLIFIGPRAETMETLGDKLSARRAAREAGLPVLPGPDQPIAENLPLSAVTGELKYPVLVKAAAGGGGKGIRLACDDAQLAEQVELARNEALAAFGDGTIFLEPLVQQARHIEVQILGDGRGKIVTIGERECSIQRRHQKLIEEAPAPNLTSQERSELFSAARALGASMLYRSLGTVEFLMDKDRQFYFIEVNPRIQVEHPVTEMVSGLDLIQEQIGLALSGQLDLEQREVDIRGSAVEARVLAEDPESGFIPTTGEVSYLKEPGGSGIRTDNALYQGLQITTDYDSLLAKCIAWGSSRSQAVSRLSRALTEFQIGGLKTNLGFTKQILDSGAFQQGEVTTTFLEDFHPKSADDDEALTRDAAVAAALHIHKKRTLKQPHHSNGFSPWQLRAWQEQISRNC